MYLKKPKKRYRLYITMYPVTDHKIKLRRHMMINGAGNICIHILDFILIFAFCEILDNLTSAGLKLFI